MENYLKLSEMASFELKDVNTVSILIYYLLRIDKPIEAEQLLKLQLVQISLIISFIKMLLIFYKK